MALTTEISTNSKELLTIAAPLIVGTAWYYAASYNSQKSDLEVEQQCRLEDLTLEKAVRHKLEYIPDWFVKGLDVVYK